MRIWSLHPRYLDSKGLVALWRETLLAKKVLSGLTRGYRHHPQLERFRVSAEPVAAVSRYLATVLEEARSRGYRFDPDKVGEQGFEGKISVNDGQILYEARHLLAKLEKRGSRSGLIAAALRTGKVDPNPLFRVVHGGVEDWERIRDNGLNERKKRT